MLPFGIHMVLDARFRSKECRYGSEHNNARAGTLTIHYFESVLIFNILHRIQEKQLKKFILNYIIRQNILDSENRLER